MKKQTSLRSKVSISFDHERYEVKTASTEDIFNIYNFAKGRYEACRINGPEIKLPWWHKNSFIFYVIHDKDDKVCANINLLPLKSECYYKIRQGSIEERDISPNDLWRHEEREKVNYVYVEGFNCMYKTHARELLLRLDNLLSNIADTNNVELVIGAIGGTVEGERIMTKLGFGIAISKDIYPDNKCFFEINYQDLKQNIINRTKQ